MTAHDNRLAGLFFEPLQHGIGAIGAIPEGFRRHAHDHGIGRHAHRHIDSAAGGGTDIAKHDHKALVIGDARVGNADAGEMVGHPAWPHRIIFGLHAGVGRRCYHREFCPIAQ